MGIFFAGKTKFLGKQWMIVEWMIVVRMQWMIVAREADLDRLDLHVGRKD